MPTFKALMVCLTAGLVWRFVLVAMLVGRQRRDWLANGLLFRAYRLNVPWVMPATLLDTFMLAYPTERSRSAWIGIAVHSAQSVFLGIDPIVVAPAWERNFLGTSLVSRCHFRGGRTC